MLLHIQTDDFRSIRHMVLAGWRPKAARNCSFSLALNKDTVSHQVWEVTDATPLHFALCCGLFQAAAVLLVAFPEHADVACRAQERSGEERHWTALGITSFLAVIFKDLPAKTAAYSEAAAVLLRLQTESARVPFVHMPSPVERLQALGPCPTSALAALTAGHATAPL